MYCILIEFHPLPGKEQAFIEAWSELTKYIYRNYGSKGSRLHLSEEGKYIAYAQWPSREVYNIARANEEGNRLREQLMESLQKDGVRVLEKLEVVEDYLETTTASSSPDAAN
jgi:quinol monooxygenase YgiN